MTWEGLSPPYRTIVADPPWVVAAGPRSLHDPGERTRPLSYSTMTVKEIEDLPVRELAAEGHLYLWTINRYVDAAYDVVRTWGYTPSTLLVWCKPPKGRGLGGAFGLATEFVLVGRRASARYSGRVERNWWDWSRGRHSEKPSAFYDLVERVSPGPYVELFARQPRLGWDSWGWGYENAAVAP